MLTVFWGQALAANLTVTLIDKSKGRPMGGITLIALEINGQKRLKRGRGVTNAKGKFSFALNGLGNGKSFLIRAVKPFRDGNNYTSPKLTKAGGFSFRISPKKGGATQSGSAGAGGGGSSKTGKPFTPATRADLHLLNRTTFGPTPELLAQLGQQGRAAFIDEQLHPERIDDSALKRQKVNPPKKGFARLQYDQFTRALYSRRQLLEMMTQFWDNHFNTATRTGWERKENDKFRANALGKFRKLLGTSAASQAMLSYLDNQTSRKEDPNENYSRELMELHTMGVDGGYTSQDVVEVARAFTGWRYKNNRFTFDPKYHDPGKKVVLGQVIQAGGGQKDGEQVLDRLARHPSTARFICRKLGQLFISDKPRDNTVQSCANVFRQSDGDIRAVVRHLLSSPAFNDSANFHDKYKTPVEFIAAMLRALDGSPGRYDLVDALRDMGMPLFTNAVPTGYPESGAKWIDSNQYLRRVQFANQIAFNKYRQGSKVYVDPAKVLRDQGLTTAQGAVGYLLQMATSNDYTDRERQTADNLLTDSGKVPFNLNDPQSVERLRRLVGLVYSLPTAQLQ